MSLPVTITLKHQKVLTFANHPMKTKKGSEVGTSQRYTALLIQLFLSLQSRPDADMKDFCHYYYQKDPPSLSYQGPLRPHNKSDILECLKAPTGHSATAKAATVVVFDMTAVVHMVRPTSVNTFTDYVPKYLVPFLMVQLGQSATRVDAVWDTYPEENLKTLTHQHHGLGPITRIRDGHTRIPKKDWNNEFLTNIDNKRGTVPFPGCSTCQTGPGWEAYHKHQQ